MIKWKNLSNEKISKRWNDFILSRQKGKQDDHITMLCRESLVSELLERLERAEYIAKGYKYFIETMKREKQNG